MNEKSVWPAVLGVCAVVLLLVNTVAIFNIGGTKDVVVPTADEIAAKVKVNVPASTNVVFNDTAINAKLDKITAEMFKDDAKEAKSIALVNDELDTKSFKQDVYALLVDNNASIEDYKDIGSIVIKASDVSVSGDSASVEYTLKVSYDSYGDDESAKIKVTFDVIGLDSDNFEDAEVDGTSFEFIKFYN